MIVEDNELNMKLFHDLLEAYGYRTIGTGNGLEVPDLARKYRPDLILMDISLPVVDGTEATRQIKAAPETKHIPVIALTTSDAESDVLYAYGRGVNSYIRKPSSYGEFVDVMKVFDKYWHDLCKLPG